MVGKLSRRFNEKSPTAGPTQEVTFEPVDGPVYDRIDHAYRANYDGGPPPRD